MSRETQNYKDHIADWIFHYNIYRKRWEATTRNNYNELFSGNKGNIVAATTISTLVEVINRKLYKTIK